MSKDKCPSTNPCDCSEQNIDCPLLSKELTPMQMCIDLITKKSDRIETQTGVKGDVIWLDEFDFEELLQSESSFIRKKEREAASKVFELFVDYPTTQSDIDKFLNENYPL